MLIAIIILIAHVQVCMCIDFIIVTLRAIYNNYCTLHTLNVVRDYICV